MSVGLGRSSQDAVRVESVCLCVSVLGLRDFFVPKIHETAAYDLSKIENAGYGSRSRESVLKNVPDLYRGCIARAVGPDTHPLEQ